MVPFDEIPAEIIRNPPAEFFPENRRWQGCPSVETTAAGNLWAAWYSGGAREPDPQNYCVVARRRDGVWEDPCMILRTPPGRAARVMDAEVWRAPSGRLYAIWSQTTFQDRESGVFLHDGVFGVWEIHTDNPDAPFPVWSAPGRWTDGFMRNKPAVLRDGSWMMCAYDWCNPANAYSYYVSRDGGESWSLRNGPAKGGAYRNTFDETVPVEKTDGTLWLLARTGGGIAEGFSRDGGNTWTPMFPDRYPNPGSRFSLRRLPSGALLFLNHDRVTGRERANLTAFLSADDGGSWPFKLRIDGRDAVSYPESAFYDDGGIAVIYDHNRNSEGEILLAEFTEEDIRKNGTVKPQLVSRAGKAGN